MKVKIDLVCMGVRKRAIQLISTISLDSFWVVFSFLNYKMCSLLFNNGTIPFVFGTIQNPSEFKTHFVLLKCGGRKRLNIDPIYSLYLQQHWILSREYLPIQLFHKTNIRTFLYHTSTMYIT